MYVAQPTASLQKKGQLYFDQLQAVYKDNHEELVYTDVTKGIGHFQKSKVYTINPLLKDTQMERSNQRHPLHVQRQLRLLPER